MATWFKALSKTRQGFGSSLAGVFGGGRVTEATVEELEATLLKADVPVRLVAELLADIEENRERRESLQDVLRRDLVKALGFQGPYLWKRSEKPLTLLIVGVNGSGKTTTTAKLAWQVQREGLKPLLGAGDTFRAAGSDQLRLWADRVGCEVVAGRTGGDAAAVAFDAVDAAVSRGSDVLFFDTAGRMHTKKPLMQELDKVRRAMSKRLPSAPHETWIVLDASIGQNALAQARMFHEIHPLTGVVVAKLDGSSKAGFLFAVARELGVPVRFVGLGEQMEDLVPFQTEAFVDALLGIDGREGSDA